MVSRVLAITFLSCLLCLSFAQGGGLKQVIVLQKTQAQARSAFAKHKNAKTKAAYVDATNALAYATMTADGLTPKVKYPKALQLYREVLKVDPQNKVAKTNADMIVSIYKSMHRPVPGGG